MNTFPNQTVPEGEKKSDKFIKEHFDYADQLLSGLSKRNALFDSQMQKFNGKTDQDMIRSVTNIKGKLTSMQFIDYRWHYAKIQIVNNEYLKRPSPTYVYSRNKDVVNKKEKKKAQILGAYMMKKEVSFLRDLGVQVFQGSEVPENEDSLKMALDIKTNNERTFSRILKNAVDKKNMQIEFARSNMHIIIGMRAFSRIEILSDGRVEHTVLDPRTEICEYQENDPFRKRTQIHGAKIYLTPSEIVDRYGKFLTKEQIQKIYDGNGVSDNDNESKYFRSSDHDGFQYAVTHIEWKTKEKTIWKVSEDKKDPNNPYRIQINAQKYEDNKASYDKDVKRGKYKIEEKYKDNIMEAVRIGEDIYCMAGYKKYCLPEKEFSYTSVGVNTYDGRSISLIDLTFDINFLMNTVQMKIRETIKKYVGTLIVYDEGKLPAGKDTDDIFYDMVEEGIVKINTRATGNASSSNFQGDHGIQFMVGQQLADLGQLINVKNSLAQDLEDLTSINKERSGASMASQTATGVRQNMSQSRVMTYHINLFTDLHVRNILTKYVESIRISHAFIKPLEESNLLNELDLAGIQIDPSASYDRLGVQLSNIEREMEIRERLQQVIMPLAVQREKIELADVLKIELSETVNEMVDRLEQSMERFEKIKQQEQQRENENQNQQIEGQTQGAKELQALQHENKIEEIVVKGQADALKDTLDAKNNLVAERANKIIKDNAAFDQAKNQNQNSQIQQ